MYGPDFYDELREFLRNKQDERRWSFVNQAYSSFDQSIGRFIKRSTMKSNGTFETLIKVPIGTDLLEIHFELVRIAKSVYHNMAKPPKLKSVVVRES